MLCRSTDSFQRFHKSQIIQSMLIGLLNTALHPTRHCWANLMYRYYARHKNTASPCNPTLVQSII
jgi:hypothetical protein